jgi:rubrerythrin
VGSNVPVTAAAAALSRRNVTMTAETSGLRQLFTSSSLGQTAYRVWALEARQERRFNIARVFDALGASKAARAEYAFQQLGEVGNTTQNVERALNSLEPEAIATGPITGTNPVARDLLMRAKRAIAEDRDLRAGELGDIFVCGRCGYIREGELRGACVQCGTVPEGHKMFTAIEAMGTCGPHAVVHFLERTEAGLRTLTENLSDELLARRPARPLSTQACTPSIKELIGHLVDIDAVFRERAWLLLETNRPELPPAHPPKLDSAVVYRTRPIAEILESFHTSRKQTLALLRGLTSAAWHRKGFHELYGEIDLVHQGNWMLSHEKGHLIELAQIRHDLLEQAGLQQIADEPCPSVVIQEQEGE